MIAPSPGQFRTVVLEGSQTSYAQYRQWHGGGANCSLELEFRTSQPDGLLLYTDNRDLREYMQLKLVNGGVNLRFNWGDGAHVLSGKMIDFKIMSLPESTCAPSPQLNLRLTPPLTSLSCIYSRKSRLSV